MLKYLAIAEPDDVAPSLLQPLRARQIVFRLVGVRIAIDLHHKTASRTIEVDDESADWVLAPEPVPIQLCIPQLSPQTYLRGCLREP
jgi:hypothetical protein